MGYTRRDFGKLALAGLPAAAFLDRFGATPLAAASKIKSRINGVQIGAITYSFRTMAADQIVNAYQSIGLGEMELMSNHAEALAGAPAPPAVGGGRRGEPPTPEQVEARQSAQKALAEWRRSASAATFKPVRKKIESAGIDLKLLCYNMSNREQGRTGDDEIEYAFNMAKWLDVDAISTSTQVSMAKRLAPFADKHKMRVGFHGHSNLTDPEEVAKPESFEAVMAPSKYLCANLDIGHYTEAGYDPVAFIEQHHDRITNLHLKDKKTYANGGGNVPWGQGDTKIKACLKLLQAKKWDIPANIEFEYAGDPVAEVTTCFQYCKDALA